MKDKVTRYTHTILYTHDSQPAEQFLKDLGKEVRKAKKLGFTNLEIEIHEDWGYYDDLTVYLRLTGEMKEKANEKKT